MDIWNYNIAEAQRLLWRARLFERIIPEPNTGCWLWMGAYDPKLGYGTTRDWDQVVRNVHRVVYREVNGPIPDGCDLDHKCRFPPCVNPEHLEPVTRSVNILRGFRSRDIVACNQT